MSEILQKGQVVRTEPSNLDCTVEEFLGEGGQGQVYRANLSGKPVALKWYFPPSASIEQRSALEQLIRKDPPTPHFLWPAGLASAQGVPDFGYIMPLRDPRYKSLIDLMKRRAEPTFRALATAGLGLSHSFHELHAKGLCYRDISFGNAFFDPANGEILICDNDNVAIDGEGHDSVGGTMGFMAPEIYRGEAKPSMQTDLFSLSVLLFYMFMVHHPLEGAREAAIHVWDLPARYQIYGYQPVFIFDPTDTSNRPVPGYQDNALAFWPVYPQFLRDLFIKAFTSGIRDPRDRVFESEWRKAMVRLRDSIIYCSGCGAENFYDAAALQSSGGKPGQCWSCRNPLQLPYRIRIGSQVVMLNHDTRLFPFHIDEGSPHDFAHPFEAVAEVSRHPTDLNVWGLRNLTKDNWVSTSPTGATNDVGPGQSVRLDAGVKVRFAGSEGEVRI